MRKSVVTALCVVMASLLLCLGAVWYFFGFAQKEPEPIIEEPEGEEVLTFADGVIVDGLDISGMTLEEAASALNKLHVAQDEDFRLVLFFEGFSDAIEYPDITVAYNTTEILNEAIQFGNIGTTMRREEERARVSAEGAREGKRESQTRIHHHLQRCGTHHYCHRMQKHRQEAPVG